MENILDFSAYNILDYINLIIVSAEIYFAFVSESTELVRRSFLCLFLFWRFAYNVGLGYVLRRQSNDAFFTKAIARMNESFVKKCVDAKIKGHEHPIEFKSWILFRNVVDVVLVNDFVCYLLFAYKYWEGQVKELSDVARIAVGLGLIVLNVLVKKDAHRVVKDYAWCTLLALIS